jgi:hypothetical protein
MLVISLSAVTTTIICSFFAVVKQWNKIKEKKIVVNYVVSVLHQFKIINLRNLCNRFVGVKVKFG